MANAAMWAIARVTEFALSVGVPKGVALATGKFVVGTAINVGGSAALNAFSNAGRQRAEPASTTFRADTDAGIPVAFGRCPPSSVLEFAG